MISQILAGIAGIAIGSLICLGGFALYIIIPELILQFQYWRERRKQVGKWVDYGHGQIDRPCGACAHCGYDSEIHQETRLFRNRVTVRRYFYCGITKGELTREQAFYKSDCAHWTPCRYIVKVTKELENMNKGGGNDAP